MARRARAEVEGGLYHVITRGNNRRRIFNSPADYQKFLSLLAVQKSRLPFFLYAYCLMPNHVHLLIERQADAVGRIMHRLLTGYSQYYNRRYRRVGHLLQGRYKALLCQSDRYLSELVRYIHLNPVRAKLVDEPEQYEYSGHRAYLGLDQTGLVDVDPVLRHFGAKKASAQDAYRQFVARGMKLGHNEQFYLSEEGQILGTDEFVDATIHRLGQTNRIGREGQMKAHKEFNADALIEVVEEVCKIPRTEFFGSSKRANVVTAKEMFVFIGTQAGANLRLLAETSGMSSSTASRRNGAARLKVREEVKMSKLAKKILKLYRQRCLRIAESRA